MTGSLSNAAGDVDQDDTVNLIEGLHEQMKRARKLQAMYLESSMGFIGASIIDITVRRAEQAIANGDLIEMVSAYKALEELE